MSLPRGAKTPIDCQNTSGSGLVRRYGPFWSYTFEWDEFFGCGVEPCEKDECDLECSVVLYEHTGYRLTKKSANRALDRIMDRCCTCPVDGSDVV